MFKLIKIVIAILIAMCSSVFVMGTTFTAIQIVEAMRISGEISTALAYTIGGLSGVSLVFVCGTIFAILIITIIKIIKNKVW